MTAHITVKQAVEQICAGQHLTRPEAGAVIQQLFSGTVPDEEIVRLLAALRDKGETASELAGFAEVMRGRAADALRSAGVDLEAVRQAGPLLDTCGTGGDGRGTFNVSTAAAFVVAAAGVRVAKHGNRSISSRCGSADVLEALGVAVDLPFERIPQCLDHTGMVFLFAPHLHVAVRHVMKARRALATKSVFNLLGPLTNPLSAELQLLGVYDRSRTEMMAEALVAFGSKRAFVVAAWDGLDEISTTGPTQLTEAHAGAVSTRHVAPQDFGLTPAPLEALAGGSAESNARSLRAVLEGQRGHPRDIVLANVSAALVAADRAGSFVEGVSLAEQVIDSGAALQTLMALVEFTRRYRY
jgi:anthranilate phosphoribosyltransferase